jgi:tetratricopeptide (TPR) repeat protein
LTNPYRYVTFLRSEKVSLKETELAFDKTTIIQNAQKYTIKGQIDKAIDEWQKIVKESPNDGNTLNTIGDLYLKKNDNHEAISSYLKAARAFDSAGFSLKTIAVYKKIIKIDPENTEIQLKMADLDAERGLIGNAIEEYLKIVRRHTKNGLHREAIVIYKKIVNLDSTNIQMRLMLASLCEKEKDSKDAIEQYLQIAGICKSQGKVKDGEDALHKVLALEPEHAQASNMLKDFDSSEDAVPPPMTSDLTDPPMISPDAGVVSRGVSFQEFSMTDEIKSFPVSEPSYAPPPSPVSVPQENAEPVLDSVEGFLPEGIDLSAFESPPEAPLAAPVAMIDLPETAEITNSPSPPEMDDEKIKEKLAEGEFYSQQGLLSEARIIYETILKYSPGNKIAISKLEEILGTINEPAALTGVSFDQVFSEPTAEPLLTELPAPPPDSAQSFTHNSFTPGTVKLKTTILDTTEKTDFVNLMGELEGEFKEEIVAPSDDAVQDDDFGKIIKEFQKGIQANIGEKDFETHFDLGVAYKEMGLKTEAIGEFQIAIKGGGRAVDSAILLSQCYLEEGLPKLAVEQLSSAIQMPQLNHDQIHSLKYELAALYELQERYDEALNVFSEVYKENVNYRDVSKKISQIRQKTPRKA